MSSPSVSAETQEAGIDLCGVSISEGLHEHGEVRKEVAVGEVTTCTDAAVDTSEPATFGSIVVALLGNMMPVGGLLATGFSLASTSIGAGILGLPSAFNSVGIVMATIYLLLITIQTAYSMRILVVVCDKTGLRSYEEMMAGLVHPKGIYFTALIRFLHCFGALIAYTVTVGDLIKPIIDDVSNVPEFLLSTNGVRVLTVVLWILFFLPLSIPRQINSLRYVSAVGLFFILFFCFCIMLHSGMSGMKGNVKAVNTGNDAISGLGVFIFSYMCQVNCVEIYTEMAKRSVKRFTLAAAVSMSICGVLYYLTGLFGYLEYGDTVQPSILLMFNPLSEVQFLICYMGVFIKICASYGLLGNACRSAISQALGWKTVALKQHLIMAIGLASTSLLCGLFIPNVGMVFGFIGGFCGGFIAFILPALFYMYSGNWTMESVGVFNYFSTYLCLVAGCVAIVFGTSSTIYQAVVGNN